MIAGSGRVANVNGTMLCPDWLCYMAGGIDGAKLCKSVWHWPGTHETREEWRRHASTRRTYLFHLQGPFDEGVGA